MAAQLRLYRVLVFFRLLEYNLSVGLLWCTIVRNATVRLSSCWPFNVMPSTWMQMRPQSRRPEAQ